MTRIPDYPTGLLKTKRGDEKIPLIGLGTWKSEPGKVKAAVVEALKSGYLHVDCASVYENEGEVGEAFQEVFEKTQLEREEVFVTSKLWNTDHAPDRVEAALKKSLKLLRLDYLDLYLMHWPVTGNKGSDVVSPSILDTWKAMEDLVERGFVKAIGVSNFSEKKSATCSATQTCPSACARWSVTRTGPSATSSASAIETTSTSPRTPRSVRRTARRCSSAIRPS